MRNVVRISSTVAVIALVAACGGGEDAATETTQPVVVPIATTTTVPLPVVTSTLAPVSTAPVAYVTEGAGVLVANGSTINGAAGRLTDRLAIAGFSMIDAANSADSVQGLETTQIYFDPAVGPARSIAESIKQALGGGSIQVIELVLPALTESGDIGSASVLVLMGNDVADKSLDELQGVVTSSEATSSDSAPPTSDSTSG